MNNKDPLWVENFVHGRDRWPNGCPCKCGEFIVENEEHGDLAFEPVQAFFLRLFDQRHSVAVFWHLNGQGSKSLDWNNLPQWVRISGIPHVSCTTMAAMFNEEAGAHLYGRPEQARMYADAIIHRSSELSTHQKNLDENDRALEDALAAGQAPGALSLEDQFVVAERRAQLVATKLKAMNMALMKGGAALSMETAGDKLLTNDEFLDALIDSMWLRDVRTSLDRVGAALPHPAGLYPHPLQWLVGRRVKEFRYGDSRVSTELTALALKTLAVEEAVWGNPHRATGSNFLRWCSLALCMVQLNPHYMRILLGRRDSMSHLNELMDVRTGLPSFAQWSGDPWTAAQGMEKLRDIIGWWHGRAKDNSDAALGSSRYQTFSAPELMAIAFGEWTRYNRPEHTMCAELPNNYGSAAVLVWLTKQLGPHRYLLVYRQLALFGVIREPWAEGRERSITEDIAIPLVCGLGPGKFLGNICGSLIKKDADVTSAVWQVC